MIPRQGESVHYLQHRGRGCVTAIVDHLSHPYAGDDDQWCVSLDEQGSGSSRYIHHHVAHGHEPGHWHHRSECEET